MTSLYPGAFDAFTNPAGSDQTQTAIGGRTHSQSHGDLADCIEAIEAELGLDPSGAYATVAARLAALAPAAPIPAIGQYLLPWNSDSAGNPTVLAMAGNTNNPITPLLVSSTQTFNAMVCRVMTNQAAVNAKMLLYAPNANQQGGSLVVASAGFTCASGAINEISVSTGSLSPGVYWGTIVTDAGTTVAFLGCKSTNGLAVTDSNGFLGSGVIFRGNAGTYASPAATLTLGSMLDGGTMPTIALKRSA